MRHEVIDDLVAKHIPENAYAEQWDAAGLKEGVRAAPQPRSAGRGLGEGRRHRRRGNPRAHRPRRADERRRASAPSVSAPRSCAMSRSSVLLQTLDHLWREHLVNLDHLRPVDRLPRLRPARSAERIQDRGLRAVPGAARQSAPGRDRPADARRAGARGGRRAAARRRRETFGHHIDAHHRRGRFRRGLWRRRGLTASRDSRRRAPTARPATTRRPGARSAATSPAPAARARNTSTATARSRKRSPCRASLYLPLREIAIATSWPKARPFMRQK